LWTGRGGGGLIDEDSLEEYILFFCYFLITILKKYRHTDRRKKER
jgi:hypothetical protein